MSVLPTTALKVEQALGWSVSVVVVLVLLPDRLTEMRQSSGISDYQRQGGEVVASQMANGGGEMLDGNFRNSR